MALISPIQHERRRGMKHTYTKLKSGTDWARLRGIRDEEIDFSDIPPIDRSLLKRMVVRLPEKKAPVSIRLDPGVLAWFRRQGQGYQTHINAVLRSYVEAHPPLSAKESPGHYDVRPPKRRVKQAEGGKSLKRRPPK